MCDNGFAAGSAHLVPSNLVHDINQSFGRAVEICSQRRRFHQGHVLRLSAHGAGDTAG